MGKISFKAKIMLSVGLVILLGSGLLGYYAVQQASTQLVQAAQKKLQGDLNTGLLLLNTLYPGEWSIQGDKLYKGTTVMNDNMGWLDTFGQQTGDTATLFQQNTRIATNVVKQDGSRAVGTQISEKVGNIVLKRGQAYRGVAEVVGQLNQAAYIPLKDAAGKIVGIWYVGVPNEPYEQATIQFRDEIIVFIVVEVLVALLVIWLLARRLLRPLVMITRAAEQVAGGSLQVQLPKVQSRDEIGRLSASIQKMMTNLGTLMQDIRQNMYTTASHISASSQQFSRSLEEMSSSYSQVVRSNKEMNDNARTGHTVVQQSVSTVDALSALITEAAQRVDGAVQDSQYTQQTALRGQETMEQTIQALETFAQVSQQNAQIVGQLQQYSQEIRQIAATIAGIARSTNLLALNASIEAARAGEAGRGFAVVASEVRMLAEQASEGADAVEQFTSKIGDSLAHAIAMMNEGRTRLEEGRIAAQSSEQALAAISAAIGTTSASIQEVSVIARQKVEHAHEMNHMLGQLQSTMEHTLTASSQVLAVSETAAGELEQLAAGSEELDAMSSQLQHAVSRVLT
ncbi:methyl-accepting chemotaxis protein [Paenibacillus campi]|uniref:methyl-accepting chemotaxis protein n=1 Tax=Paenibacillus campi TaxID=3106031 RepID=UPI002AFF363F|nr:methyl-accepting chemotaxis protein [Paenibacillus sp. SGZ-1009]